MTIQIPFNFSPPIIERRASLSVDFVFSYGDRMLRVHRTYGDDDAAPVILETLTGFHKGQFALWSRQGVMRAIEYSQRSSL